MREGVDPWVLEPARGINTIYETRIAGNEGWNPQGPHLLTRWMADEVAPIPCGCTNVMCQPCDRVQWQMSLRPRDCDPTGVTAVAGHGKGAGEERWSGVVSH